MRSGYAVDLDPTEGFFWWQTGLRVVIKLLTGDDMHIVSARREVGGKIADQPARSGLIRRKKAIEEENAFHQRRRFVLDSSAVTQNMKLKDPRD